MNTIFTNNFNVRLCPLTVGIQPDSSMPSPRAGHSMTFDAETLSCLVFGGASHEHGLSNELFRFHILTSNWEKLETNKGPDPRYEHAALLCKRHSKRVLIIMMGASEETPLNDIWCLDLESMHWTCLETRGSLPKARTLHSAIVQSHRGKDRLYIFGGGMAGSMALPDAQVYCLDLDSLFWVCVSTGSLNEIGPTPRLGHTLTCHKNYLYVLGGMNEQKTYNDVWRFDLEKHLWESVITTGDIPSPRVAHTTTLFEKEECLIMYGGMQSIPKVIAFDDLYVLDLKKMEWKRMDMICSESHFVSARLDHDAGLIPLVKRRTDGISDDLDKISPIESDQNSTIIGNEEEKCILVFGGMNTTGIMNDVFELHFIPI